MNATFNNAVRNACINADALQANVDTIAKYAGTVDYATFRNAAARVIGQHYKVEPHEGKATKLLTFEKDTAAEQKLSRICKLHPEKAGAGGSSSVDPVTKLLKGFDKLSGAQKRSFKAALAKL